jgi:hypothetical protein
MVSSRQDRVDLHQLQQPQQLYKQFHLENQQVGCLCHMNA